MKEVRQLSNSEFETLLSSTFQRQPKSKKPRSVPRKNVRPKDSPVARIAAALKKHRGLTGDGAKKWLGSALNNDGIDGSMIPGVGSESLEEWLDKLLKTISSSVVYDVVKS